MGHEQGRPEVVIPWTPEEEEYFREREERTVTNRRVRTSVIRRNDDGSATYDMRVYLDGQAAGGTLAGSYDAERILAMLKASAACYLPVNYQRVAVSFPEYRGTTIERLTQ